MYRILVFLPLAIGLLLVPQLLRADEGNADQSKPGGRAAKLFAQLDANHDGHVTTEEVPDERRRLFDRLIRNADKDGDGKLSSTEFTTGLKPRQPKKTGEKKPAKDDPSAERIQGLLKRLDTNNDGSVAQDEVPERFRNLFTRMLKVADKDGDGTLGKQELRKAGPKLAKVAGFADQRPEPRPDRPPAAPIALMHALDADGDGTLSEDEIASASAALNKLDRNKDGSVSPRELLPPRPDAAGFRPDPKRLLARILSQDQDGDGKISREEAPERLREHFDAVDADGDGSLSKAELRKHMAAFAKRLGEPRPDGQAPKGKRKKRPGNRPDKPAKESNTE